MASPDHADIFLGQILGIGDADQTKVSYRNLRKLIAFGQEVDLYKGLISAIEERFDGVLGEELYADLDIEKTLDAEVNQENVAQLQSKKRHFLSKTRAEGEDIRLLMPGLYGSFEVESGCVSKEYKKREFESVVRITLNVERLDGTAQTIELLLDGRTEPSWDFLREFDEVPDLYNAVVAACNDALSRVLGEEATAENHQSLVINVPEVKSGMHYQEPIYKLRKLKHIEASTESPAPRAPMRSLETPLTSDEILEVVFPEAIRSQLGPDVLEGAERAIGKYRTGLQCSRRFSSLWENGRKVYRLRSGNVRVLVENVDGQLVVIAAGLRSTIYK